MIGGAMRPADPATVIGQGHAPVTGALCCGAWGLRWRGFGCGDVVRGLSYNTPHLQSLS